MSFPTKPCYIKYLDNGWEKSREHPVMAWHEKYCNLVDSRAFDTPYSDWHTDDFELHKADGTIVRGGKEAWEALGDIYRPFAANLHDPVFPICWETENGWEMMGWAYVCIDLPVPGDQPKVKDRYGKEWDVIIPGAFKFEYVRDPSAKYDGIKFKKMEIFYDTGPALKRMLQRGMIKPEELMQ
ncbi:hypothetical protein H2201_000006 [Coniosporium apollinis]|uniref:SnoaL-like domain-containing protein n=2 Tax=Coniosporium TaxID=2810619 RepID=A0ABQ9P9R2_9PEZI|nr:hypothetical protein H2199_008348 [Cladosporium sp. JES 115]KAJ9669623.1 hypothetical protein H2201_000006 [Coniosporium apollinis]